MSSREKYFLGFNKQRWNWPVRCSGIWSLITPSFHVYTPVHSAWATHHQTHHPVSVSLGPLHLMLPLPGILPLQNISQYLSFFLSLVLNPNVIILKRFSLVTSLKYPSLQVTFYLIILFHFLIYHSDYWFFYIQVYHHLSSHCPCELHKVKTLVSLELTVSQWFGELLAHSGHSV